MGSTPSTLTATVSVEEASLRAPTSEPPPTPLFYGLINLFIVVYWTVVGIWLMPESQIRDKLSEYVRPIFFSCGLIQYWSLFSPDVRERIYHCNAIITFADGSHKNYEFPRPPKMGQIEKFQHEKLRKLFLEYMPFPSGVEFLPDFARFVARCNADSKNPPTQVSIVFSYVNTPPPNSPDGLRDSLPEHIYKSTLFNYRVKQEDLQ